MPEYLSEKGLEKIKKDLDYLKNVKRKEIAERLELCISEGDLSENSGYLEAKEDQGILEGRIIELENIIRNAVVVPLKEKHNGWVQIGSTILVSSTHKKERFTIVGTEEANPIKGKISVKSPLGKAILNKPKGATIKVLTPRGEIKYKILKII